MTPHDIGTPMSAEEFLAACPVSRETMARLDAYLELLRRWNGKINLVSAKSLADPWRRHMLDSAQLARYLPKRTERVLVDMGSGAGFPGLVLAILGVGEVHLVEANNRKAVFLEEAARTTGTAVTVHARRLEDVTNLAADVVTARALAPIEGLLRYAGPFLRRPGPDLPWAAGSIALFLKGRGAAAELTQAQKSWNITAESFPSLTDRQGKVLRLTVPD